MPSKSSKDTEVNTTEVNTEDVNTGDAVEVSSSDDGDDIDTGDDTVNVDTGDEVNVKAWTYVEVAVQLGSREHVRFRREFAGGEDTSPLEILDHLTDAMKSYLESD